MRIYGLLALTGTILAVLPVAACSAGSAATNAAGASTSQPSSAPPSSPQTSPAASAVTSPATASASAPSTGGPCAQLNPATVASVFTVQVGNQAYEEVDGPGHACLYGIGANAAVSGAALATASDDVMSATLVASGGAAIYASEVANYSSAEAVVPLSGVGDKAGYAYSSALNNPPVIIAVKGDAFCDVTINPASGAELGLAASTGVHSVRAGDAAGLAKKEAQFCVDLFAAQ